MKKIVFMVLLGTILTFGAFQPAAEAADPQPFQLKTRTFVTNVTLQDGTKGEIRGDRLFLIGADGKRNLARDGVYLLQDGKKITVVNGKAIIDDN